MPTQAEIEVHKLTHLPMQQWCPACMQGKSRASDHRTAKQEEVEASPPKMQMDYCYMRVDGSTDVGEDGERPKQPWATTLTAVDEGSQTPLAISLPTKSPEEGYTVKCVVDFVRRMAYKKLRMRVDNESSLLLLANKVKDRLLADHDIIMMIESTPRYSSQSLGAVGACQRACHEQVRTMRIAFEKATTFS